MLASETFAADGPAKRPSVQVGDPFMEKLLIECTLELFAAGLVAGIQDLGGAGLSCATSELASAGDGGMHVELDRVPLRDSSLAPEEILMSESQERMMAVVEPEDVDGFLAICAKWEVEAVVIGEVTDTGRLRIDWHGERVVDVPPRSVAHDGPTYHRPFERPDWQDALQADARRGDCPGRRPATSCARPCCGCVGAPNLCDKSWITDQYDRYVRGNTVLAQPSDSGMVRVDEETGLGVSVATDCNGRFAKLDPYAGAQLALAEAYRNVATGGASPLAVSDCLNFGSPEDPAVMWQFAEACRGLKDACLELGIPVTGGNVSLYNQTGETAILPTPVVAVLGVIDDVPAARRRRSAPSGEVVYLLGETRDGAVGLGVGARRARPPRRAAAGRRPRGRARAGRPAARRRRAADLRPRPLRRRAGAGAGRGVAAHGVGVTVVRRRRRLRRAVLRVRCPLPGHRPRPTTSAPSRRWPAPSAYPSPPRHDRRRRPHRRRRVLDPDRRAPRGLDLHASRRLGIVPCGSGSRSPRSPNRTGLPGAVHNEAVDDLVVSRSLTVRDGDLKERFTRSSGPGGQGVNTADSRVELSYDVANAAGHRPEDPGPAAGAAATRLVDGVLTIAASEHRTQLANRKAARERLVEILREAAAPPPRSVGPPSRPGAEGAPAGREEAPRRDQAGAPGPLGLRDNGIAWYLIRCAGERQRRAWNRRLGREEAGTCRPRT